MGYFLDDIELDEVYNLEEDMVILGPSHRTLSGRLRSQRLGIKSRWRVSTRPVSFEKSLHLEDFFRSNIGRFMRFRTPEDPADFYGSYESRQIITLLSKGNVKPYMVIKALEEVESPKIERRGRNLVSNPTFEDQGGWEISGSPQWESFVVYEGNRSMRTLGGSYVYQDLPIIPGQWHGLSAMVKGPGVFRWQWRKGSLGPVEEKSFANYPDFICHRILLEAPSDATGIRIHLAGDAVFDNVWFGVVGSSKSLDWSFYEPGPEEIALGISMDEGEEVIIDMEKETVSMNGQDLWNTLSLNSSFWGLGMGRQSIIPTSESGTYELKIRLKYGRRVLLDRISRARPIDWSGSGKLYQFDLDLEEQ